MDSDQYLMPLMLQLDDTSTAITGYSSTIHGFQIFCNRPFADNFVRLEDLHARFGRMRLLPLLLFCG